MFDLKAAEASDGFALVMQKNEESKPKQDTVTVGEPIPTKANSPN